MINIYLSNPKLGYPTGDAGHGGTRRNGAAGRSGAARRGTGTGWRGAHKERHHTSTPWARKTIIVEVPSEIKQWKFY